MAKSTANPPMPKAGNRVMPPKPIVATLTPEQAHVARLCREFHAEKDPVKRGQRWKSLRWVAEVLGVDMTTPATVFATTA